MYQQELVYQQELMYQQELCRYLRQWGNYIKLHILGSCVAIHKLPWLWKYKGKQMLPWPSRDSASQFFIDLSQEVALHHSNSLFPCCYALTAQEETASFHVAHFACLLPFITCFHESVFEMSSILTDVLNYLSTCAPFRMTNVWVSHPLRIAVYNYFSLVQSAF